MSEADAVPYVAQLEAFVAEQAAFVQEAEAQVSSPASTLGGQHGGLPSAGFGQGVNLGARGVSAGSFGGGSAFASNAPQPRASFGSPSFSDGGNAGLGTANHRSGGQVTPATDQRLSAVISQVVARLQEFEGLRPQLGRLPQHIFSRVAQQG